MKTTPMTFKEVFNSTGFIYDDDIYMKIDNSTAVNLSAGYILSFVEPELKVESVTISFVLGDLDDDEEFEP